MSFPVNKAPSYLISIPRHRSICIYCGEIIPWLKHEKEETTLWMIPEHLCRHSANEELISHLNDKKKLMEFRRLHQLFVKEGKVVYQVAKRFI